LNKRKPQQPASPRRGFWEARHGAGNIVGNPKSRPLKKNALASLPSTPSHEKTVQDFFQWYTRKNSAKSNLS
jgi:hypothetical protein